MATLKKSVLLAQRLEHWLLVREGRGSIPLVSTNYFLFAAQSADLAKLAHLGQFNKLWQMEQIGPIYAFFCNLTANCQNMDNSKVTWWLKHDFAHSEC